MVKYPVQSMIGGTLLLTLAFSLNDGSGSAVQSETDPHRVRLACDSLPHRDSSAPDFLDPTPVLRCIQHDAKK